MYRLIIIWTLFVLAACQFSLVAEDPLVAQVFDKKLHRSEVDALIPESATQEDSVLIRNAYIERWIKKMVMMHEAEMNIPADLEIDRLVDDYKSSLIMHQYEKSIVETLLDTVIDDIELEAYYEENKSQYLLESVIIRCHMIKLPQEVDEKVVKECEKLWKGDKEKDFEKLVNLCNQYASTYFLSDSIWYKLDLISQEMPAGAINENAIRNNEVFQLTNDDYYYFLKILDIRDKKEIAPLTFIREQASKVILHKRKIALLDELQEDLYDRASSRDNIKLY